MTVGITPLKSEPVEELPAFVRREIDKWGDIVRQVGIAGTQ